MTLFRPIEDVFQGAPTHMVGDGFPVSNYFPSGNSFGARFSPFILMDYVAPVVMPPSDVVKGVGAHPHRGFQTVTIAYEGSVEHHDNFGNHGVIGPGDVQWMNAGSGLLHKEYHEREFSKRGGLFQMIQLWVNLPRAHKMSAPNYQELRAEKMGMVELPEQSGVVRVIAGDYNGVKGPANTFTPMSIFDISLKEGGIAEFQLPETHNTAALVLKGGANVNGKRSVKAGDFVLFQNTPGKINLQGTDENTLIIALSGEPIDEPVFQHGPFVMNSKEELIEAFKDFQAGKMGSGDF